MLTNPVYEMVTMTPDEAKAELATPYSRQRPISSRHVGFLGKTVETEEFNPFDPLVRVFVKATNSYVYVNGYHRLTMASRQSSPIVIARLTLDGDTISDAEWLYATYDRQKQRTLTDIIHSFGDAERLSLNKRQGGLVAAAGLEIDQGFPASICGADYHSKSPTARNDVVKRYGDAAAQFFKDILGGETEATRLLERRGVLAVAIVTYSNPTSKIRAREFWRSIAFDDGLKVGDPRKTLLKLLRDKKASEHTAAEIARLTAHAWNAFIAGETLTHLKNMPAANGTLAPIQIKGTQFKRKFNGKIGASATVATASAPASA